MEITYCRNWSNELKAAEARRFRAECKLRCLKAALDKGDIENFDSLMDQIADAQAELYRAADSKFHLMLSPEHNPR